MDFPIEQNTNSSDTLRAKMHDNNESINNIFIYIYLYIYKFHTHKLY